MNQPNPTPGGASSDRTGRFVTQPNGHIAPLSPHITVSDLLALCRALG